jgi:hypothetical protein
MTSKVPEAESEATNSVYPRWRPQIKNVYETTVVNTLNLDGPDEVGSSLRGH